MDTIKLIITEPKKGPFKSIKTVDVVVALNDKALPHDLFNTSSVLAGVKFEAAQFDLFTCECGVAGCVGLHEMVEQTAAQDCVTWWFPPESGYKSDKERYHFDRKEFELEFSRLQLEILRLEKLGIHMGSMVSTTNGNEVFSVLEHMVFYEEKFQSEQDTARFFTDEFKSLNLVRFIYTYGDKSGQFDYSLHQMVRSICNSHNDNPKNWFYRARCKYIVRSIVEALEGKMEALLWIAQRYHMRYGCTVFDMVSCNLGFEDDKESEFDIKQLGLKIYHPNI